MVKYLNVVFRYIGLFLFRSPCSCSRKGNKIQWVNFWW